MCEISGSLRSYLVSLDDLDAYPTLDYWKGDKLHFCHPQVHFRYTNRPIFWWTMWRPLIVEAPGQLPSLSTPSLIPTLLPTGGTSAWLGPTHTQSYTGSMYSLAGLRRSLAYSDAVPWKWTRSLRIRVVVNDSSDDENSIELTRAYLKPWFHVKIKSFQRISDQSRRRRSTAIK